MTDRQWIVSLVLGSACGTIMGLCLGGGRRRKEPAPLTDLVQAVAQHYVCPRCRRLIIRTGLKRPGGTEWGKWLGHADARCIGIGKEADR
jgi:hypothetical protein